MGGGLLRPPLRCLGCQSSCPMGRRLSESRSPKAHTTFSTGRRDWRRLQGHGQKPASGVAARHAVHRGVEQPTGLIPWTGRDNNQYRYWIVTVCI